MNIAIQSILNNVAKRLQANDDLDESQRDACLRLLSFFNEYDGSFTELDYKKIKLSDHPYIVDDESAKESHFVDWRIREMTFKNFRMFPRRDVPFGLRFIKDSGCPCSVFLIGRNNNAKSTIFDAIEYFYTKTVSNAELKGIFSEDKIKAYLIRGFGRITDPPISDKEVELGVSTQHDIQLKDFKLSEIKAICLPAPFISENDIVEIGYLGTDDGNLYDFFMKQLGYTEVCDLLNSIDLMYREALERNSSIQQNQMPQMMPKDVGVVIKDFLNITPQHNKYRKIDECNRFHNKVEILNNISQLLNNKHLDIDKQEILFTETWKELLSNARADMTISTTVEDLAARLALMYRLMYNAINSDPVDAIRDLSASLAEANTHVSTPTFEKVDNELFFALYKIRELLEDELRKIVVVFVDKYGGFIEDCLNQFLDGGEIFKLLFDKNKNNLHIQINVDKEGSFRSNPNEYLNTFRFKIYAISVKLALAFWYMQENRCILPVVLDDVFNAGDFENTNQLQQFVSRIYHIYHKFVDKNFEYPLQLIMFTHDERVLNAFRTGILMRFYPGESTLETRKNEILRQYVTEEKAREELQAIPINMRIYEWENYLHRQECYKQTYILGRLFPYYHIEKLHSAKKIKVANANRKDKVQPFLNLYLPIQHTYSL